MQMEMSSGLSKHGGGGSVACWPFPNLGWLEEIYTHLSDTVLTYISTPSRCIMKIFSHHPVSPRQQKQQDIMMVLAECQSYFAICTLKIYRDPMRGKHPYLWRVFHNCVSSSSDKLTQASPGCGMRLWSYPHTEKVKSLHFCLILGERHS